MPEDQSSPRKSRLDLIQDRMEGEKKEPQKEEAEPAPPPSLKQEPSASQTQLGEQYTKEQQQAQFMSFESNTQPAQRDRRHEGSYAERTQKANLPFDRRIWPYVNHLLNNAPGLSRADRINRIMLQVLLDRGYPIDPDILDRPFNWNDVPRQPK